MMPGEARYEDGGRFMNEIKTDYGVDWSARYGAMCPVCGVYTKESYKHTPWKAGYKERYHVCPNPECRRRFKSIAEDPVSRVAEPEPEQLRYLRDYGGRRGGVKVPKSLFDASGLFESTQW